MSVIYLPSYIEKTYTENDRQTYCENGVCTSIQSLCNLENDDIKCLEKYSIPNGLVVHNHTRKPIRASNSNNVIENNNFDILYDMLVLKNVNASKSTVKNNKGNETKTRKKH
tara:strand:- start:502 stop:837 length:336 start_codon:yes stop_codon:yes gene_type:complete